MPMPDFERIKDAGKSCFRKIVSHGITSLGVILQTDEEGVFGKQGQFDILLMNTMLDAIPVNLYSLLVARDEKPIEAARKTGLHNPRIGAGHRIGGLKFWADGTWNSCTAFMNEPFADRPDTRGMLMHSMDEMYRRMKAAHNAGLQIAVHVIGDAATRALVDLFDRLLKEFRATIAGTASNTLPSSTKSLSPTSRGLNSSCRLPLYSFTPKTLAR